MTENDTEQSQIDTRQSQDDTISIAVRIAQPGDDPYLSSCWLKSIFKSSSFAKQIPHSTFYGFHRPIITSLLGTSTTLVAHPEGDEATILGYVVTSEWEGKKVLHWLYVRDAWRGVGIAAQLLASAGIDLATEPTIYTFATFDAQSMARKYPAMEFNPYLHLLHPQENQS